MLQIMLEFFEKVKIIGEIVGKIALETFFFSAILFIPSKFLVQELFKKDISFLAVYCIIFIINIIALMFAYKNTITIDLDEEEENYYE